MRRQPARDVVSEDRRERRSRDTGHIGLFERREIYARAAQLRNLLRNQLEQLVGEPQHLGIRRISAIEQQRLVEANQRLLRPGSARGQVVEASAEVPCVRLCQMRVWKLPGDPDPSGVDYQKP